MRLANATQAAGSAATTALLQVYHDGQWGYACYGEEHCGSCGGRMPLDPKTTLQVMSTAATPACSPPAHSCLTLLLCTMIQCGGGLRAWMTQPAL